MSLTANDRKALDMFKERIASELNGSVTELVLFGSKAKNTDTRDSDLDVLVVVNERSIELEERIIDIAFEVNMRYDLYLSPRVIDAEKMKDRFFRATPFCRNLEQEGIPL